MAVSSLAECAGVITLSRRLIEDQKEAGLLSEAEATCRALGRTLLSDPSYLDTPEPMPIIPRNNCTLLPELSLELACIVRAQGRLDEARQLCEQADSQVQVSADPF